MKLFDISIRFCAVALDDNSIAILGGEYPTEDGIAISEEMKTYAIDSGEWVAQPSKIFLLLHSVEIFVNF